MIAVPITSQTLEEALQDIEKANSVADAIELRLDFLKELNETILKELIEQCKKPVIVTFRNQNFGASTEPTERMFLLKKAIDFNAHYIDLDFDKDKEFIQGLCSNKKNSRIILSHHDFEKTPPLQSLVSTFNQMLSLGVADVIKIVTFANQESDNDTILSLIPLSKKEKIPIIAFCMGPKGIRSRIKCIKMGALLSFASLEKGKESASGQLSIVAMRKELNKND